MGGGWFKMTLKEYAAEKGVSVQAVYKRLKAAGLKVESLKSKETGHLTAFGLSRLNQIFSTEFSTDSTLQPEAERFKPEVETVVEKLKIEVERLKAQVEKAEAEAEALRSERDYLRGALENAQKLQAATLSKVPTPPPALPTGQHKQGFFARLLDRIKHDEENIQGYKKTGM